MLFEELPDGPGSVEIAADPADHALGHILSAPGPGVAAAVDAVEDDLAAGAAAGVPRDGDPASIVRVDVGLLLDAGLVGATVGGDPALDRFDGGYESAPLLPCSLHDAAIVWHEGVVRPLDDEDRDRVGGRDLVGQRLGNPADHGSDGGDTVGELDPQTVRHKAAVGRSGGEHPFGVDSVAARDIVNDCGKKADVVDRGAAQRSGAVNASVFPPAVHGVGIRDKETMFIGERAHTCEPGHLIGAAAAAVQAEHERSGFCGIQGGGDAQKVAAVKAVVEELNFPEVRIMRAEGEGEEGVHGNEGETGGEKNGFFLHCEGLQGRPGRGFTKGSSATVA